MRKGMNHVLALIVTASVLMMAALTVMYMLTDLPDDTEDAELTACRSTVKAKCSSQSSTISAPASCIESGSVPEEFYNRIDGLKSSGGLDCSER